MREMKNSGFPWLGEIPSNWKMQRVKHCFYRKNDKAEQEEPVVLSLARSGVKIRDISNNEGQVAESYYNYNPVDIDDLLLNPMDLYSGANCSISTVTGVISPAYVNLRALDGINPKFYDYYFKLQYWLMAFFSYGKGVSFENRWTLNTETLMNYPVVVPTYEEQSRIADYLAEKCGKIDSIIEKQEQVVEKLKSYKQAYITDAVIRGIDENISMKDSGVPYIGSIPEHWKMVRLKFLLTELIDCPHETPVYSKEGRYLVIRTADQDIATLRCDDDMYRLDDEEYKNRIRRSSLEKDDIVYGREGGRWGIACLVPESNKYCLGQRMLQFRCNKNLILPEFCVLALSSNTIYLQGSFDTMGSASPHVNISTVQNYWLAVPPLEEQKVIAQKVRKKITDIEDQVNKINKYNEKLFEYKKSLIYEMVTGKREV